MLPLRLADVQREDVLALVANAVPEGRALDYKQALPGTADADRKEFLADVASFANATGGDIVFGVVEQRVDGRQTGLPEVAEGLSNLNADAEKLRLDNLVRDGIAPRVPLLEWRSVDGFPAGPVLVLRISKSWTSPHMVTFKGTSRFFSRNSSGKYQLDVGEIRSAFASGEQLGQRLRRFRDDRVASIAAGEASLPMETGPKTVLHMVPASALDPSVQLDPQLVQPRQAQLEPIYAHGWDHRYNLEGLATYAPNGDGTTYTYVQVFRTGALEAVESGIMSRPDGPPRLVPAVWEQYMVGAVSRYMRVLRELGGSLPIFIMVSLVDVMNVPVYVENMWRSVPRPLDRRVVMLPDVVIERDDVNFAASFRLVFDSLWQAAGLPGSANYDATGQWVSRPR
jgi:hypothetical protein